MSNDKVRLEAAETLVSLISVDCIVDGQAWNDRARAIQTIKEWRVALALAEDAKVEPVAGRTERNDTFARSLEFRLPELDAARANLDAMTAERDAALKQRDYNREVIARRNVTLARSEATLAAMTAERNDALGRESKVVEYAAKIQAERNAALAQIAETNTAFDVVLARVETNAKDAHMGRWVNNNLRGLVALHRGDTTASKDAFYDSVSQQLKQLDAILGKGAK